MNSISHHNSKYIPRDFKTLRVAVILNKTHTQYEVRGSGSGYVRVTYVRSNN
jgi:hypothetical protein